MLRGGKFPPELDNGDGSQSSFRFHLFLEVMPLNKSPLGVVGLPLQLGVFPNVTVALDDDQIQY
jgi:hypothetical protein